MIRSSLLSGAAIGLLLGLSALSAGAQSASSTTASTGNGAGTFVSAKDGVAAAEAVLDGKTIEKASPDQLNKIRHILDQIVTSFPASDAAAHILLEDKVGTIDVGALDHLLSQIVITKASSGSSTAAAPPSPKTIAATPTTPQMQETAPSGSTAAKGGSEADSLSGATNQAGLAPSSGSGQDQGLVPATQMPTSVSPAQVTAPSASGASVGQSQTVTQCDRLAADPGNPDNPPGVHGVPDALINVSKAVAACQQALTNDPSNQRLQFNLAHALAQSKNSADLQQAWSIANRLASSGYPAAEAGLGAVYVGGLPALGITANLPKAHILLVRAAGKGVPYADGWLGQTYAAGMGVKKSMARAVAFFKKGAKAGDSASQYFLGLSYANGAGVGASAAEATYWFKRASENGSDAADNMLGLLHLTGQHGFSKDYTQAFKYLSMASDKGNLQAKDNLAYLYSYGYGTGRDPQMAAQLYYKVLSEGANPRRIEGKLSTQSLAREILKMPASMIPTGTVSALQRELAQNGYYHGAIDGGLGPETRAAMGALCLCK